MEKNREGWQNSEAGHPLREEKQKAVANRIAKIIGHTKSIKTMVENGRDCSEVLIQLSAVKAAVNNTGKEVLKEYRKNCLEEAVQKNDTEKIRELSRIIDTFVK